MDILAFLLNIKETAAKQGQNLSRRSPPQNKAGYTLIEVLVVVMIITVLAAIAAPSWLSFVNQRRVNAANDFVLRSLQDAQSQAKSKKLSYSVSLIAPSGGSPALAIHPGSSPPSITDKRWKSFAQELGIKPKQIWLGTNASNVAANLKPVPPNGVTAITFDYLGTVQSGNNGLVIAVAAAQANNPTTPLPQTNRCVAVTTLLGAMQTGKSQNLLTASPSQCQPR
jgi:prepilin-type N-terminal cleavage/methylation domain-containing protein